MIAMPALAKLSVRVHGPEAGVRVGWRPRSSRRWPRRSCGSSLGRAGMTKARKQRNPPPIPDGGVWAVTSQRAWEYTVYERGGRSIYDFMVRTGPVEADFFSLDTRVSPSEVHDIRSDPRYAGCVFPGQFMKCQVLEPVNGALEVGGSVRLSFDRAGMAEWMQDAYGSKAPELTFEDAATTGDDGEQPAEAAAFEVMVEENAHHGEDGYLSHSFASAEEALVHARQIVDDFFEGMSGKTARELFEQFIHFGDSPYIPGVEFSAREYARTRCAELGENPPKAPEAEVGAPTSTEEAMSLDAVRRRMYASRPPNQTASEREAWDAMVREWEQSVGIAEEADVEEGSAAPGGGGDAESEAP